MSLPDLNKLTENFLGLSLVEADTKPRARDVSSEAIAIEDQLLGLSIKNNLKNPPLQQSINGTTIAQYLEDMATMIDNNDEAFKWLAPKELKNIVLLLLFQASLRTTDTVSPFTLLLHMLPYYIAECVPISTCEVLESLKGTSSNIQAALRLRLEIAIANKDTAFTDSATEWQNLKQIITRIGVYHYASYAVQQQIFVTSLTNWYTSCSPDLEDLLNVTDKLAELSYTLSRKPVTCTYKDDLLTIRKALLCALFQQPENLQGAFLGYTDDDKLWFLKLEGEHATLFWQLVLEDRNLLLHFYKICNTQGENLLLHIFNKNSAQNEVQDEAEVKLTDEEQCELFARKINKDKVLLQIIRDDTILAREPSYHVENAERQQRDFSIFLSDWVANETIEDFIGLVYLLPYCVEKMHGICSPELLAAVDEDDFVSRLKASVTVINTNHEPDSWNTLLKVLSRFHLDVVTSPIVLFALSLNGWIHAAKPSFLTIIHRLGFFAEFATVWQNHTFEEAVVAILKLLQLPANENKKLWTSINGVMLKHNIERTVPARQISMERLLKPLDTDFMHNLFYALVRHLGNTKYEFSNPLWLADLQCAAPKIFEVFVKSTYLEKLSPIKKVSSNNVQVNVSPAFTFGGVDYSNLFLACQMVPVLPKEERARFFTQVVNEIEQYPDSRYLHLFSDAIHRYATGEQKADYFDELESMYRPAALYLAWNVRKIATVSNLTYYLRAIADSIEDYKSCEFHRQTLTLVHSCSWVKGPEINRIYLSTDAKAQELLALLNKVTNAANFDKKLTPEMWQVKLETSVMSWKPRRSSAEKPYLPNVLRSQEGQQRPLFIINDNIGHL